MRVDRSKLGWGVFLIALGGVPLAVQEGWLEASAVDDAWRLWPLILVGIGLGMVLKLTRLAWLGGAVVSLTFGLVLGSLLATGVSGIGGGCVGRAEGGDVASRSGLAVGDSFRLDVEMTCGQLVVARGTEATWAVEAIHTTDRPPTIEGTSASLRLRPDYDGVGLFALANAPLNEWSVRMPAAPALSMGLTLNAARGRLELGPGPAATMAATLNAADVAIDLGGVTTPTPMALDMTIHLSSAHLDLPAGASIDGVLTLAASALEICLAEGADVRIDHNGTLSSADFAATDMIRDGDAWQTPGYSGATQRIDLDVTSTVSSIFVKGGTCS